MTNVPKAKVSHDYNSRGAYGVYTPRERESFLLFSESAVWRLLAFIKGHPLES
jgi:hypothetical protein